MKEYNKYIGIPWVKGGYSIDGADCWGLSLLVLREMHGIVVREYIGSCAKNKELTDIIVNQINSDKWNKIANPKPGDVSLMYDRKTKLPTHMGVFIGDGKILHSPDSGNHKMSQIHPVILLDRVFMRLEYYRYDISNS